LIKTAGKARLFLWIVTCLSALAVIWQARAVPASGRPLQAGTALPEVTITVFSAGKTAEVAAPLEVGLEFNAVVEGPYRLELLGEEGRLLYRRVWAQPGQPGTPQPRKLLINFEIPEAQEPGRMVLSLLDRQGRFQAVDSVDVLLSTAVVGSQQAALENPDRLVIQSPVPGRQVKGGTVLVSGQIQGSAVLPVKVLLLAEDGQVVGQRLAATQLIDEKAGTWQFSAEVPFKVWERTPVRLQVIQSGEPLSEIKLLASVLVDLSP
jgi:hypothetical protein